MKFGWGFACRFCYRCCVFEQAWQRSRSVGARENCDGYFILKSSSLRSNTRTCITDVLTLQALRHNFASVSSSLPTINHFVIYHSRVQSVNSIFSLLLTKTFFASFYNIFQAIRLFHFHFHRIQFFSFIYTKFSKQTIKKEKEEFQISFFPIFF